MTGQATVEVLHLFLVSGLKIRLKAFVLLIEVVMTAPRGTGQENLLAVNGMMA